MSFNYAYQKPKIIAEIGCNHMGNFEIARELIALAKDVFSVASVILVLYSNATLNNLFSSIFYHFYFTILEAREPFL